MNISLDKIHVSDAPMAAAPAMTPAPAGEQSAPGLQVTAGATGENAPIPGEEAVSEAALRRDDGLGNLVDRAYDVNETAATLPDINFLSMPDAGEQVAKNIGESAERLKENFIRNREAADIKKDRLEAVLTAEAARAASADERLDAIVRECQLQV